MKQYAVLFCCTGNICRSPTAEAVFRNKVVAAGVDDRIVIDSAGTHGYHVGAPPDYRAQNAAKARSYDLSNLRGRRIALQDFERFDLVVAMDYDNRAVLERLCPPSARHKLKQMMAYARHYTVSEVPDPYSGGPEGFETVLDMLEDATGGLLDEILSTQNLNS